MTQNYYLFIVVLLFLFILWGNLMYRKAVKALPADKQIDLSEIQRSYQLWTVGLLVGMMALFFIVNRLGILPFTMLAATFVGITLLMYGFIGYLTYKKMKEYSFEAGFLKSYLMSNGIRLLAILLLLATILIKEGYIKH
jgi:hypothetical protein